MSRRVKEADGWSRREVPDWGVSFTKCSYEIQQYRENKHGKLVRLFKDGVMLSEHDDAESAKSAARELMS